MGSAVSATTPPDGARAYVRGPLPLLGPAFVAAIAYVDPGNFATNITAGSTYGYLLVWVLLVSNAMAMLIQYLSAKAGIATGLSLPELLPPALLPAGHPRAVGAGGGRGHGDRPRRGARRRDRAVAAVRRPAAGRRRDHRRGRLRAAAAAGPWPPPVRGRDHRPARRDPARLLLQPAAGRHRPRRLRGRSDPALRRLRQRAAGGGHARRHRDAARDLPARGAHPGPVRARHRGAAPEPAAQPAGRRDRGDEHRWSRQPVHAGHRRPGAARTAAGRLASRTPTPAWTPRSALPPHCSSRWRCWRRGSPRRAWARTPVRSSCRASCSARSR